MNFSLKASLKLSQQLKMTPQLQQAIKLLQLSRLELENEIRNELNENPVLEEFADTVEEDPGQMIKERNAESDKTPMDQDPKTQDEMEWENYLNSQYTPSSLAGRTGAGEEINYDNFISKETSLHDHLDWQAQMSGFEEKDLNCCLYVISYIDENGYLEKSLEELAAESDFELERLEVALSLIHEFDPHGVGARSLEECLLIQARHLQEDTPDVVHIIKNHMKDLELRRYDQILKSMNIDKTSLKELSDIIKSMDPKPGRAFASHPTQYVVPDVYIHEVAGEYMVTLNEEGLPRLRLSKLYREDLKKTTNAEVDNYVKDKTREAVWLIRSIHQRQRTIFKVAESIVKHQLDFFKKGSGFIRPMILKDIANDIEMHESTVSRVTTNKYVHTPRGIFELKYFFNSGVTTDYGEELASESIKLKIKDFLSKEDAQKPYSDQKIVDFLKEEGISIARRTVAKYRESLGILPSSQRKSVL